MSSHDDGPGRGEKEGLSLADRLDIVYKSLDRLQMPSNADEAFRQLSSTLEEVEDEFSGVPQNPNPGLKFDGRMYPPRDDFITRHPDGSMRALTKGNVIEIWPNGAMLITHRVTGQECYRRGWPPS